MYIGINQNRGKAIYEEDAFVYALEKVICDDYERQEFIEWFFSGDWIKED
ncbi:hypothetical protein [Anaerophilus nitritogenes]|nr:hypothetical protein [Anaerophilus nitritogenes]